MKNFEKLRDEWRNSTLYLSDSDDDLAEAMQRAADLGLSVGELEIFQAIWYDYGQVRSKETLAHNAFGSTDPLKVKRTIERCFDDGLIQHLTADFVSEMTEELNAGGYLAPSGLIGSCEKDLVGLISFTRRGVDLYGKCSARPPEWQENYATSSIQEPWEVYGTSEDSCRWALDSLDGYVEYVVDGPPIPIGRWCDRWWNRFESGYRLRYTITKETDRSA